MKGYYFHNMDVRSTRAHASQILNTVAAISAMSSNSFLSLVLPKYHDEIDLNLVKKNQDLPLLPNIIFLQNFGLKKSGIVAFCLFNLPAMWFLFQKKLRGEVDFLYFRTSYFLPVVFLARILSVPIFYETHRRPISRSERWRDHLMSRLATGIIVISSYMREHYLSYGKNILVAHDAVSLKRFAESTEKNVTREKLGLRSDEKVCVYAGTVSKLKGLEYVSGAAQLLPGVTFLLVGSAAPEFAQKTWPANVRLMGRVDQEKLPAILQSADVLLLPHPKGEYSQSPMKLFEYMASGVPIVASRLPSISEVLNDKNAILVEPENEKDLARGIEKALGDRDFSRSLADKAWADVQNYTWEKRGAAIESFIKETMAGR